MDSDDRKRRRRAESGRGPAPEVNCNPQPSILDHHLRFREKLTAWNCVEVVAGSKLLDLLLLLLLLFLWVKEAALQTDTSKLLYQGPAPTREPTCSLELSLPSPAGIWFKTPSPVGGANTVEPPPRGELVSRHPRGGLCQLQRPGVWGSLTIGAIAEYPLNLQGASCPA